MSIKTQDKSELEIQIEELKRRITELENKLANGTTNDYWVSDSSGGAVTTKLTVVNGVIK